MSDSEILSHILTELKDINNTVQDLYSSMEAQNEMIMNRLTVLDTIAENSKNILTLAENNKPA
jgi:hypothetical protein